MKRTILLLLFATCLITGYCPAQKLKDYEVPAAVKDAFATRFPDARDISWSKENSTGFEAEFEINNIEQSVNFDDSGKWLGTETEIKKSELPKAVISTLAKEFPGYKIEEVEKAETSMQGNFYEVELEKKEILIEVQVTGDGNVLKKEEKKEKESTKID